MKLTENEIYHVYNQGNNRERIFHRRENYLFFLKKFRRYVLPYTTVLAYCLMPNHFHFVILATKETVAEEMVGNLSVTALANGFRKLLSSYAQAINKQEQRTGSLFRQKTKAKLLEDYYYPTDCFHYVHHNPVRAGLVRKMEDWEFSSFRDYVGVREGSLCCQWLAYDLLNISKETLYQDSYRIVGLSD